MRAAVPAIRSHSRASTPDAACTANREPDNTTLFKVARRTEDVRKAVTIVDLLDRFVSDKTVAIQQITLVDTVGVTSSRSGYRLRALGR